MEEFERVFSLIFTLTVCLFKELISMLHMFLESSLTITFRDVGTIEQVLNRLPFQERYLDYINSRIFSVFSLFRRSSNCH